MIMCKKNQTIVSLNCNLIGTLFAVFQGYKLTYSVHFNSREKLQSKDNKKIKDEEDEYEGPV
jgi:hypothetical protein